MARFRTRIRILAGALAVASSIGLATFATTGIAAATPTVSAASRGTTQALAGANVVGPSSVRIDWGCRTWRWRPAGTITIHCQMSWGGIKLSDLSRTCHNTSWCYLPASGGLYYETVPIIPNGLTVYATGRGPAGKTTSTGHASI